MARTDYAYPFSIDPVSGQAAQAGYAAHVEQMIWQVLMTDPGERVCLPDFGCGLRRLLFAPNSTALQATAQLLIIQNLTRWLGSQITVNQVQVSSGAGDDDATLNVVINYTLVETQSAQVTQVRVT
jgi:phage baseplate assembly protein W